MKLDRLLLLSFVLALPVVAADDAANKAAGKTAEKASADRAAEKLLVEPALVTPIDQAEVPARVEGVFAEFNGREGQLVTAGQVLARLDDVEPALTLRRATVEYEIARKQAKSTIRIDVARKAAAVADVELKRAKQSNDKYKISVSEAEIDRLRLSAEKAALDIEQAVHDQEIAELTMQQKEVERQLAEAAVERRRIVAPIPGMIVQIHKHRGESVEPGQTVLRVLRVDRLRVEGSVNVRKITGDLTGRRAVLTVDLGGRPAREFEGAVVFVSPEVNPVNGQVRIWAEVENRDLSLRPGLQGTLTIEPEAARTAKRESP